MSRLIVRMHRFVKHLIRLRLSMPIHEKERSLTLTELLHRNPVHWHGVKRNEPDWSRQSRCVAFSVEGRYRNYVVMNAYWEPLTCELPLLPASRAGWRRLIDTSLASPQDVCRRSEAPLIGAKSYVVQSRSVVMLIG